MSSGDGNTFASMSVRSGEPVRIRVSLHLDGRAWVAVPGAGTGSAHLHISHGDVTVSFCPRDPETVTAEDTRMARELADKAVEYATEIERLHAASTADNEVGDAAA